MLKDTLKIHGFPISLLTVSSFKSNDCHLHQIVQAETFISSIIQSGETDFIISVLIETPLFCKVNFYLFFSLKTGELQ